MREAPDAPALNLAHHFLIAMPGLQDSWFAQSVVYVCDHGAHGALGLIINKPSELDMRGLFHKVDLPLPRADLAPQIILQGGPLQVERGFVLHDAIRVDGMDEDQTVYAGTLSVPGGLDLTTSRDVLEAISTGGGPARLLMTLGYASWGEGQLEAEIADNSWLTVPADERLIFDTPIDQRYDRALGLLGLQAWMLAPYAGHG